MSKFNFPKMDTEKIKKTKTASHTKTANHTKVTGTKAKKPIDKVKIFNIVSCVVVGLAHVLLVVVLVLGSRYFSIYPSLIGSLIGIVLCVVVMIDIVYFIGYKHKDMAMKITSFVLSFLLLIVSTFGTYYVGKTNTAVSGVIGTTVANDAKYETISGVFVIRTEDANSVTDISKLSGKLVGYVSESETGVATIGMDILDDQKIDYAPISYNTYDEMIVDIYDGKIDAGIFLDGYRGLYERNKEEGGADYTGIISTFTDLQTFSKDVDVTATASTKDISKDPFNILLIGYSRTAIGSSIGLADAIIIASVNPKTYTVSMMSIARDSYVPISCYGGTKDKINSARGTSRACFIQTVEDYTGMTMDFYMEADYEAVVAVVDAIEGITITNPVSFNLDGIDVPAGTYTAWGWQVLEFCRERHHMPNGDFDRQQHQKEVIIAIAEKLIKKADITLFLNAIEAAGDKFSTNLTLSQLTGMFNMILQTKNYTGLKISKLIDFHQLRLTGYSDWYYNESMSLPLWIYKIYQGSYDESIAHAKLVLGEDVNTSDQTYSFSFDTMEGYDRPLFYSLTYDEEEVHEELPAYYPNFVGMTYEEAVEYCNENNITVNWSFISSSDSNYNAASDGYVVSQSLRYGVKVSAGTNTLTVMGNGKVKMPDFEDMSLSDAKDWCEEKKYDYTTTSKETSDKDKDGYVSDMYQKDDGTIVIEYYKYKESSSSSSSTSTDTCDHDWGDGVVMKAATCDAEGLKTYTCSKCGKMKNETIAKLTDGCSVTPSADTCDHDWGDGEVTTAATCDAAGEKTYTCSKCGETKTEAIAQLTGDACPVATPAAGTES